MEQPDSSSKQSGTKDKRNYLKLLVVSGWGLAILFLCGIIWKWNQNLHLKKNIEIISTQNKDLKNENIKIENQLTKKNELLTILRSKDFQTFTLNGNQAVAPQAFSKVYWNKKEHLAFIDVAGLPAPPEGKVYKLWSFKNDFFSPTNIGLIKDKGKTELYQFDNFPEPEILCITLENDGGSKTPTMTQIYVMHMPSDK